MKWYKFWTTLLLFSTLTMSYAQQGQSPVSQAEDGITLEDLWLYYRYYPQTVSGYYPMNDGSSYTIIEKGNIVLYSYATGKKIKTLVSADQLQPKGSDKPLQFRSYTFSEDEQQVLIPTKVKPIYRHSFSAEYWIYNLKTKQLEPLSRGGAQRLATFSPDGSKVAFMRDNNLYYTDLASGEEHKITTDGEPNKIINGAPDWVYEEEFSFTRAFRWSPDSKKLAFLRFDESKVKEYELTYYGDLYPKRVKYKYPKAGEDNSVVSARIYELSSGKTTLVDVGENTDIYLPRIQWSSANKLAVMRLNRLQNHLEILLADAATGKTQVIYDEKNPYYIEITKDLHFLDNGRSFILSNENSGYRHLYLYNLKGEQQKALTSGNWDLTEVLGVDKKAGLVYFMAAHSSPLNRDLMSVNLSSGAIKTISQQPGTHDIAFSKNYQYYVDTRSTLNTPPVVSVHRADGSEVKELVNNQKLVQFMERKGYQKADFFHFSTADSLSLNGWMIKPGAFDPKKKYPVLMYVYGGPNSQTVNNAWGWFNWIWFQMLAQKGYVVVSVDGRGTGARGQQFRKCTYRQLGKLETRDQIAANRYLASLPFVDSSRIGIFGWSYGGYMASLCMTRGADYFKAGIAVAPVTNWRYYDNIYTERYMRTPQENGESYDANSPISHADELKGKFLLVHGVADDNVHIQNSMDFITALVQANKQFEMQFYPNNDHGIHYGRNTRYHLFKRMTDFIIDNL